MDIAECHIMQSRKGKGPSCKSQKANEKKKMRDHNIKTGYFIACD